MKHINYRLLVAFFILCSLPAYLSANVLEEIIVTAQKREQNLQDVAITVTAFSGDTLDELGMEEPRDITVLMPNVSMQNATNVTAFNIRGIQLLDFGDGNEPPISFYVDEVYYGTPAGQVTSLFDLERVEVLRGPQGTLFGRNSTAGLVHFITRKPTDELDVRGSVDYGSDNEVIVKLAAGGPLGDSVRARVAGKYHNRDGWQRNSAGGENGTVDAWSMRGMVEFDIGDDAVALVTLSHTDIENIQPGNNSIGLRDPNIAVPGFLTPFGAYTDFIYPVPCAPEAVLKLQCVSLFGNRSITDPEHAGTTNVLNNDTELFGASVRLTWAPSEAMELTSITAWNTVDKRITSDADSLPMFFGQTHYVVDSKSFSQELRLSGATNRMKWILGGFYYGDEKDTLEFNVVEVTAIFGRFGNNGDAILDTETWAVFGQLEYSLTDQLTLTGGIRYTDEQKDLLIANDLDNPTLIPGTDIPFLEEWGLDDGEVTGRAGIDWRPTEDILAFVNVSTGFKSGAFNTNFSSPGTGAPSEPEKVINYEAGFKTTLFDGSLRFNASVFYSDYEDLQHVFVPAGTISSIVDNVGDADIYGLETELNWLVSEQIDVLIGIGLLETEVSSTATGPDGVRPFDNKELRYAPSFSANALVRYELPFPVFGGSLAWTNTFRHVGKHYGTVFNAYTDVQEDYQIFDTVLRWNSADSSYFLEAYVKNLGNKEYTVEQYVVEALGTATSRWERLRHGGVRIGFNF